MRFTCPSCAKSYRLPPERLGAAGRAQISCPNCKAVVLVKAGEGEVLDCRLLSQHESAGVAAQGAVSASVPIAAGGSYYVVIGRDKQGPLTFAQIHQMLGEGKITGVSLAWSKGMANWTKLEEVPELSVLLGSAEVDRNVVHARVSQPIAPEPVHAQPAPAVVRPTSQAPAAVPSQPAPQPVRPAPAVAPQPAAAQPAKAAAPQPAAAQPAKPAAPQPAAAQPAKPAAPQPAQAVRASQPAPKVSPKPPVKPNDLDDAGPTLTGDVAVIKAASRPVAPTLGKGPAAAQDVHVGDAHGAAFFSSGHDLHDVELALPDPNKHKPTKEEYNKLLQEFSVMFRLDKRSKRQKLLIAVLSTLVVVGVITFGILLVVNGNRKRSLISDSKSILAVFALPYQNAVTVQTGGDEDKGDSPLTPTPDTPGAPAHEKKAVVQEEVSEIAAKLHGMARKKKAKATGPQTGIVVAQPLDNKALQAQAKAMAGGMTDEEKKAYEEAKKAGKKVEGSVGLSTSQAVSKSELDKLCAAKMPALRGCAQGGGSFTVAYVINGDGDVSNVKAFDEGKQDAALTSCASHNFKGRFGPQPGGKTTEGKCKVD